MMDQDTKALLIALSAAPFVYGFIFLGLAL
jgi:hypothetical protein